MTAAWAWLVLGVIVALYVGLWDWFNPNDRTMSHQLHVWLLGQVTGPVVFAVLIAKPAGLMFHFFRTK